MIKKKKIMFGIMLIFLILVSAWFFINKSSDKSSFAVDNTLVESKIKVGESASDNVEVHNLGEGSNFEANLVGFEGLAILSEYNFYLDSSESKTIKILFNDSILVPGSYVGYLSIKDKFDEKKIPIILSIDSKISLFAINLDVAPENKHLQIGGATKTNLEFLSLSDTKPHTVKLSYYIRDIEGKTIISEQKETVITFSLSINKIINLPEEINEGDYIFTVILTYGESLTSSSYIFSVDTEKEQGSLFSVWTLSIFIFFFVVVVFVLIGYMFYERNRLFSKLKSQQARQIRFYSSQIDKQQKKSLLRVKTEKERQKILRKFRETKKKILEGIRAEQIKQKKDFERIRKERGDKAVEKKIKDWKKSVYPRAVKQAELSHGLRIKLNVLESAYNGGYISKKSYTKGKERINNIKRKLKRNVYK